VNDHYIRHIGHGELCELVDAGEAVNIYVGKQLIGAKLCAVQAHGQASTTISKSEMLLNAAAKIFPGTKSRTANLTEWRRQTHLNPHTNRVEEEDSIERTETKVGLWPLIGDKKAVRVGPSVDVTAIYTALDIIQK
jgi:hypothetical protein